MRDKVIVIGWSLSPHVNDHRSEVDLIVRRREATSVQMQQHDAS